MIPKIKAKLIRKTVRKRERRPHLVQMDLYQLNELVQHEN
ncbi:hypothetical protein LINGRAHAP2_LOCUS27401 [Linum grandiflorum]